MRLAIIDSGKACASENMATDADLLLHLKKNSEPILHFYEWATPCATYGYFSAPTSLLDAKGICKHNLELAKRPTGGGIIFHQFDFAFSFLLPAEHPCFSQNTLENYRFVNQVIAKVIQDFLADERQLELLPCEADCPSSENVHQKPLRNFCMAKPTVYDVVSGGSKLAGGAQRRTKTGYLHQASIALTLPPEDFLADVVLEKSVVAAMKSCSFPLLMPGASAAEQEKVKLFLKGNLIEGFACMLN